MENKIQDELLKSLHSGFIDRSKESDPFLSPQILTNDKVNGKKVLSSLQFELRNCDEFWFNVAFVTTSGVATIINELDLLEKKGVNGKILVSQYQNFTQPEALKRLLQFTNISLRIVTEGNMHSKGYLFRRGEIFNYIVGSSNLTDSALKANQELNIKISATFKSNVIFNTLKDFDYQFKNATNVNHLFINRYKLIHEKTKVKLNNINENIFEKSSVKPNKMQLNALENIEKLRVEGKRKALIISATGTGKTYLSAFDVKKVKPKKFLFLVHRRTIAEKSLISYKQIIGDEIAMGLYSGSTKDVNADYLFSTIQTISKDEELRKFNPFEFDYIVIDETHRAGAESYKKIMSYFKPRFLLGMTATPERNDGFNIYEAFDYNIAYEIRLHQALEENMLSPFHYYGISDLTVNNEIVNEKSDFNKLTSAERIKHIINTIKFYGCDNGIIRGLIFCSRTEEAIKLSEILNRNGFKTIALTGSNNEIDRRSAIEKLESDNQDRIDYIISVDIFNEGVDIPKVNQVVMLRPTQSAIIFVQQLGRGLRKAENKEYLTVIDFIGNYSNNYMVPIALFGDNSFNKDNLRKLMFTGSDSLPGASTVNFDEISKKQIFDAIDQYKADNTKELRNDFLNLEHKIGKLPLMMDFVNFSFKDPLLYIKHSKSLFNFSLKIKPELITNSNFTKEHVELLELYSNEIANGKRIDELIILDKLVKNNKVDIGELLFTIANEYGISTNENNLLSSIRVLNFEFISKKKDIVKLNGDQIFISNKFNEILENKIFKKYLTDIIEFGVYKFKQTFIKNVFLNGFILYEKYSRKDVCRILNWDKNEESTIFGYKIKHNTCPIFVNYHKEEGIDPQINFPEGFIDKKTFQWFSKPYIKLENTSIKRLRNFEEFKIIRFPFFIKKHNGEGSDFYYMGDVLPIPESFEQSYLLDKNGKQAPVVKIKLDLLSPVEDEIYNYILDKI